MILAKEELGADINRAVFPGQQAGPSYEIAPPPSLSKKPSSKIFRQRKGQPLRVTLLDEA